MSWFQVAVAYSNLGQLAEEIDAYEHALALHPDYAIAMFDLGGAYWNSGDRKKATEIWSVACERFPDHELVEQVKALTQ
jgi:tetratricopeptide (TPR) repeat protein